MLYLKNILQQLDKDDFEKISDKLKKYKAEKYLSLLNFYREDGISDEDIQKKLEINSNAFYVLKSRLFEKVQEHLRESSQAELSRSLKKLVAIPNLIFNTERNTAAAILTKLEKDLIENDMPNELTNVYAALKKIHIHSDKYYEYSQLYNRHIAYTLALNKAEDLLSDFTKKLGEYFVSRNESLLAVFPLLKKEIANINALYQSHHLKVYQNIIDISIALFLPIPEVVKDDKPVEDILDETETILSAYPNDYNYRFLRITLNFLSYEYYHKHKLNKKEMQYFELLNNQFPSFFYHNHTCFCSKFLISKLETYIFQNKEETLYEENKKIFEMYRPEKSDIPNYVNYMKYCAASSFYSQKYSEAAKTLSELINEVGFLHYPHSEIEVKLFLVLAYSMCNKYEVAWNILRSATRKISELNDDLSYENAKIFAKILAVQLGSNKGDLTKKLIPLRNQFELLNQGNKRMLEFLKLDDKLISTLAKAVK